MSLGLISVLLILFVVVGAIVTKRVEICLFLACLIGTIVLYGIDALPELGGIFVEALANNAWVMLIVLLLEALSHCYRHQMDIWVFLKLLIKFVIQNEKHYW